MSGACEDVGVGVAEVGVGDGLDVVGDGDGDGLLPGGVGDAHGLTDEAPPCRAADVSGEDCAERP